LWGVEKIQNVGRCHGNQGVKNVKFTPNSGSFWNLKQK
jgi:ribosomal protein L35AE/L33A